MDRLRQRIREFREARGIKQAALARAIEVPPQTLSGYELGPNKIPANVVPKLAKALDVTICDLYGVDEHPERGTFAADQPGRIRDMVVQQLMASHNQLPEAEKKFVEDVAAAADALRQRLRREEGLGSSPTPQR